jgi:hypothetical protein
MKNLTFVMLLAWNITISLALGIVFYTTMETQVQLQLRALSLVHIEQQQIKVLHSIAALKNQTSKLELEDALLSEQTELTLDLLTFAGRSGWWSQKVRITGQQLNKVRQVRRKLNVR